MNMKVSDVKDWSSIVSKIQPNDKNNNAVVGAKNPTPNPMLAKASPLPQRAAPKTSDSGQVKKGIEELNDTKLLFSIQVLIALLFELVLKQRISQRESRMADATNAEQMQMAAADDLRDEAVMSVAGAAVSAGAQVAGAATVVGGGIRTAKTSNVMEVSNKMMTFQASSQALSASGQVAQGGFQYAEKQDEATKTLHDATASQEKSIEDSDNEDQKDETQLVQSIIQLQQKQEESRHEAVRATA